MTMGDTFDYITFGNPISRKIISSGSAILRSMGLKPKQTTSVQDIGSISKSPQIVLMNATLAEMAGRYYNFIRLGGISGVTAIIMGAYCKHYLKNIKEPKKQLEAQAISDAANRIHFLHSFMLITVPLAHYPILTGVLITCGTALFSGSMYYRALSDDNSLKDIAVVGGFCLIAAWLTLLL